MKNEDDGIVDCNVYGELPSTSKQRNVPDARLHIASTTITSIAVPHASSSRFRSDDAAGVTLSAPPPPPLLSSFSLPLTSTSSFAPSTPSSDDLMNGALPSTSAPSSSGLNAAADAPISLRCASRPSPSSGTCSFPASSVCFDANKILPQREKAKNPGTASAISAFHTRECVDNSILNICYNYNHNHTMDSNLSANMNLSEVVLTTNFPSGSAYARENTKELVHLDELERSNSSTSSSSGHQRENKYPVNGGRPKEIRVVPPLSSPCPKRAAKFLSSLDFLQRRRKTRSSSSSSSSSTSSSSLSGKRSGNSSSSSLSTSSSTSSTSSSTSTTGASTSSTSSSRSQRSKGHGNDNSENASSRRCHRHCRRRHRHHHHHRHQAAQALQAHSRHHGRHRNHPHRHKKKKRVKKVEEEQEKKIVPALAQAPSLEVRQDSGVREQNQGFTADGRVTFRVPDRAKKIAEEDEHGEAERRKEMRIVDSGQSNLVVDYSAANPEEVVPTRPTSSGTPLGSFSSPTTAISFPIGSASSAQGEKVEEKGELGRELDGISSSGPRAEVVGCKTPIIPSTRQVEFLRLLGSRILQPSVFSNAHQQLQQGGAGGTGYEQKRKQKRSTGNHRHHHHRHHRKQSNYHTNYSYARQGRRRHRGHRQSSRSNSTGGSSHSESSSCRRTCSTHSSSSDSGGSRGTSTTTGGTSTTSNSSNSQRSSTPRKTSPSCTSTQQGHRLISFHHKTQRNRGEKRKKRTRKTEHRSKWRSSKFSSSSSSEPSSLSSSSLPSSSLSSLLRVSHLSSSSSTVKRSPKVDRHQRKRRNKVKRKKGKKRAGEKVRIAQVIEGKEDDKKVGETEDASLLPFSRRDDGGAEGNSSTDYVNTSAEELDDGKRRRKEQRSLSSWGNARSPFAREHSEKAPDGTGVSSDAFQTKKSGSVLDKEHPLNRMNPSLPIASVRRTSKGMSNGTEACLRGATVGKRGTSLLFSPSSISSTATTMTANTVANPIYGGSSSSPPPPLPLSPSPNIQCIALVEPSLNPPFSTNNHSILLHPDLASHPSTSSPSFSATPPPPPLALPASTTPPSSPTAHSFSRTAKALRLLLGPATKKSHTEKHIPSPSSPISSIRDSSKGRFSGDTPIKFPPSTATGSGGGGKRGTAAGVRKGLPQSSYAQEAPEWKSSNVVGRQRVRLRFVPIPFTSLPSPWSEEDKAATSTPTAVCDADDGRGGTSSQSISVLESPSLAPPSMPLPLPPSSPSLQQQQQHYYSQCHPNRYPRQREQHRHRHRRRRHKTKKYKGDISKPSGVEPHHQSPSFSTSPVISSSLCAARAPAAALSSSYSFLPATTSAGSLSHISPDHPSGCPRGVQPRLRISTSSSLFSSHSASSFCASTSISFSKRHQPRSKHKKRRLPSSTSMAMMTPCTSPGGEVVSNMAGGTTSPFFSLLPPGVEEEMSPNNNAGSGASTQTDGRMTRDGVCNSLLPSSSSPSVVSTSSLVPSLSSSSLSPVFPVHPISPLARPTSPPCAPSLPPGPPLCSSPRCTTTTPARASGISSSRDTMRNGDDSRATALTSDVIRTRIATSTREAADQDKEWSISEVERQNNNEHDNKNLVQLTRSMNEGRITASGYQRSEEGSKQNGKRRDISPSPHGDSNHGGRKGKVGGRIGARATTRSCSSGSTSRSRGSSPSRRASSSSSSGRSSHSGSQGHPRRWRDRVSTTSSISSVPPCRRKTAVSRVFRNVISPPPVIHPEASPPSPSSSVGKESTTTTIDAVSPVLQSDTRYDPPPAMQEHRVRVEGEEKRESSLERFASSPTDSCVCPKSPTSPERQGQVEKDEDGERGGEEALEHCREVGEMIALSRMAVRDALPLPERSPTILSNSAFPLWSGTPSSVLPSSSFPPCEEGEGSLVSCEPAQPTFCSPPPCASSCSDPVHSTSMASTPAAAKAAILTMTVANARSLMVSPPEAGVAMEKSPTESNALPPALVSPRRTVLSKEEEGKEDVAESVQKCQVQEKSCVEGSPSEEFTSSSASTSSSSTSSSRSSYTSSYTSSSPSSSSSSSSSFSHSRRETRRRQRRRAAKHRLGMIEQWGWAVETPIAVCTMLAQYAPQNTDRWKMEQVVKPFEGEIYRDDNSNMLPLGTRSWEKEIELTSHRSSGGGFAHGVGASMGSFHPSSFCISDSRSTFTSRSSNRSKRSTSTNSSSRSSKSSSSSSYLGSRSISRGSIESFLSSDPSERRNHHHNTASRAISESSTHEDRKESRANRTDHLQARHPHPHHHRHRPTPQPPLSLPLLPPPSQSDPQLQAGVPSLAVSGMNGMERKCSSLEGKTPTDNVVIGSARDDGGGGGSDGGPSSSTSTPRCHFNLSSPHRNGLSPVLTLPPCALPPILSFNSHAPQMEVFFPPAAVVMPLTENAEKKGTDDFSSPLREILRSHSDRAGTPHPATITMTMSRSTRSANSTTGSTRTRKSGENESSGVPAPSSGEVPIDDKKKCPLPTCFPPSLSAEKNGQPIRDKGGMDLAFKGSAPHPPLYQDSSSPFPAADPSLLGGCGGGVEEGKGGVFLPLPTTMMQESKSDSNGGVCGNSGARGIEKDGDVKPKSTMVSALGADTCGDEEGNVLSHRLSGDKEMNNGRGGGAPSTLSMNSTISSNSSSPESSRSSRRKKRRKRNKNNKKKTQDYYSHCHHHLRLRRHDRSSSSSNSSASSSSSSSSSSLAKKRKTKKKKVSPIASEWFFSTSVSVSSSVSRPGTRRQRHRRRMSNSSARSSHSRDHANRSSVQASQESSRRPTFSSSSSSSPTSASCFSSSTSSSSSSEDAEEKLQHRSRHRHPRYFRGERRQKRVEVEDGLSFLSDSFTTSGTRKKYLSTPTRNTGFGSGNSSTIGRIGKNVHAGEKNGVWKWWKSTANYFGFNKKNKEPNYSNTTNRDRTVKSRGMKIDPLSNTSCPTCILSEEAGGVHFASFKGISQTIRHGMVVEKKKRKRDYATPSDLVLLPDGNRSGNERRKEKDEGQDQGQERGEHRRRSCATHPHGSIDAGETKTDQGLDSSFVSREMRLPSSGVMQHRRHGNHRHHHPLHSSSLVVFDGGKGGGAVNGMDISQGKNAGNTSPSSMRMISYGKIFNNNRQRNLNSTFYEAYFLDSGHITCGERRRKNIVFPEYRTTIISFVEKKVLKKDLNTHFYVQHPFLEVREIKLTQLRKIRHELLQYVLEERSPLEISTMAHAYWYFERLTEQGMVGKKNRKVILAACVMLAIKLLETGDTEMKVDYFRQRWLRFHRAAVSGGGRGGAVAAAASSGNGTGELGGSPTAEEKEEEKAATVDWNEVKKIEFTVFVGLDFTLLPSHSNTVVKSHVERLLQQINVTPQEYFSKQFRAPELFCGSEYYSIYYS